MSYLTLIRHGRSSWNDKGLWTGWTDIPLHDEGREEAKKTAESIKDIPIDIAYTPKLSRVKETVEIILKTLGKNIPITENNAIIERNYGIFTGKNKWEVKEQIGDAEFIKLRRGWDYPIKDGESLKQVYERTVPYFENEIVPKLKAGKNILIGGSGNSLRSLIKYIENISDDKISEHEIRTAEAYVYKIDENTGKMISKEIRSQNEKEV